MKDHGNEVGVEMGGRPFRNISPGQNILGKGSEAFSSCSFLFLDIF